MKLIGNGKKDYFDFLIHQYGEDPLVVLDRRPIGEFITKYGSPYYAGVEVNKKYVQSCNLVLVNYNHSTVWWDRYVHYFLVLNGKKYPIVQTKTGFSLVNDTNVVIEKGFFTKKSTKALRDYYYPQESPLLIELSKKLKRHCFIIGPNTNVQGLVPNLNDIGIPKIIHAQAVYLETVDFISKHFSKEVEVSVPQTNKEKIVGHGFDLKTSFRGKN